MTTNTKNQGDNPVRPASPSNSLLLQTPPGGD